MNSSRIELQEKDTAVQEKVVKCVAEYAYVGKDSNKKSQDKETANLIQNFDTFLILNDTLENSEDDDFKILIIESMTENFAKNKHNFSIVQHIGTLPKIIEMFPKVF